ncbi:hypothetical protein OCH239_14295 [Roseivivax halodurans JCM 10272]|uniref:Anti-sigma K factor RskA C-terminal domain-containing protein n=1 Tax=Roseivivax halodurans JCM 10272 TaxID=1449350 RepID=X7EI97_9RHOB|nr:anti-sigma factor [Roseivivax halodurans]ETX15610.1 hypothetical protein OCH239_14295 [Roseivivax halodurans JCM 10272]
MSDVGSSDDLPNGSDAALAAEYVLGLMSEAEIEAFEARLLKDERLLLQVVTWTEHLSRIADTVPEAAPPPSAKRRIEAAAFGGTAARTGRTIWRFLVPLGFGGAAVAGLAWALLTFDLLGPGTSEPELVADIAVEDRALALHAGWFADSAELLVIREAGEVPQGSDLELWVIRGEDAPVSLGLVPRQEDRIRYTLPPGLSGLLPGATLAVSLEPQGGSPSGAPTGPVLGTAPITEY